MIADNISYHLLHLLETPGVGVAKAMSILERLTEKSKSAGNFFSDPRLLRGILNEKQVSEYSANKNKVDELWDRLNDIGVKVISVTDDEYPQRLKTLFGKKAPPLLMVLGNSGLLNKPSTGFCGSRKASEKGLDTAYDCAEQLARREINIISGYAAGVDMAAHRAALESVGTTTLVLCEGILKFHIKREFKDIWDWRRIAVVSEFLPGIPWSVRNAMQRNKTICALSNVMILIEARTTGGSIEAGRESLKMGVPLFAPVYEGMPETATGNQELLKQGARPLHKSRATGRANMREALSVFADSTATLPNENTGGYRIQHEGAGQLTLFEEQVGYKK